MYQSGGSAVAPLGVLTRPIIIVKLKYQHLYPFGLYTMRAVYAESHPKAAGDIPSTMYVGFAQFPAMYLMGSYKYLEIDENHPHARVPNLDSSGIGWLL